MPSDIEHVKPPPVTGGIGLSSNRRPGEAAYAAEVCPTHSPINIPDGGIDPQCRVGTTASPIFSRQIENEIGFLRRAVRRWHREKADADDLVQDTLVQALANAHLWQPGTDLRAWLFTIMRNQFLAGVQKSSRFISMLRVFAEADHGAGGDPSETRLKLRDVAGALQRLPSPQRTAVMLVCVEGKSYEEAAEEMGISIGAARCHLARGRNRLRTAMQADEPRSLFAGRSDKKSPIAALAPEPPGVPPTLAPAGAD